MPDFWFDTDSFVTPSRGAYRFCILPEYWDYLVQKAKEGLIASSSFVLDELSGNDPPDELELWAKKQAGILFFEPDRDVQNSYKRIAELIRREIRYTTPHINKFLDDADAWVIAHAIASGGRVVTFEKRDSMSSRPKIPDVASVFHINCFNVWDFLTELKVKF